MRTIARRQPVSFTELGHFAQLDRSTVSRNVRVLDRLGLVEMTRSGEDHREAAVSLSVRGAGLLDEAMPPWERSEEHTSELQSLTRISSAVFCVTKRTPLTTTPSR